MTLAGSLIAHGSALILPMAVVEGPVVSIVAGFLSAQGYFDWYWALCLLVSGDLVGDVLLYWIGRGGAGKLTCVGRRLGLARAFTPQLRRGLTENADKMLIVGKWTQSAGIAVLIGSGMLRLPVRRFIAVNVAARVPKTALLMGLGYFAGENYAVLERHAVLGTVVAFAVGLAAMALILRLADIGRAGR